MRLIQTWAVVKVSDALFCHCCRIWPLCDTGLAIEAFVYGARIVADLSGELCSICF